MSAGRAVRVKIRASEAESRVARQGALRGLDAVGSRAPVGWPGAHLDLAHTEVERERTRQVARIGNNLNQTARLGQYPQGGRSRPSR